MEEEAFEIGQFEIENRLCGIFAGQSAVIMTSI